MACEVSLQSLLATLIAISVANNGNGSAQVAGRCIAYVRPATCIPSALLHVVPMPAWEQRKLGELTESYSGGTPAAGESEFYGGSIPFIRSAEIAAESTELFLTEKVMNHPLREWSNPAMCCMHCTERQVARWLYRGKKVPSTKLFSPYSLATIVMQDTSLLG